MKEAPRRVRKEAASHPRGRFLPPVPLCARGLRLGRAGPSATRAGENG